MPTSTPNSDLAIADLPEDLREEGQRLKAQYHALASDAGLLTEAGAVDLGRLGDLEAVKRMDLTTLRALAETAEALKELARLGIPLDALQQKLADLGLDTKFERSIEDTVAATTQAYAEGAYGFTFDPRSLRFDPALLPRLQQGLEAGALNGLVITAYPTLEEVSEIARRLQKDPEELLNMPVTEFLLQHFAARGGTVFEQEERTKEWKELRWALPGTPSLAKRFRDIAVQLGVDPRTDVLAANGSRTVAYKQAHAQVYRDLPVQQTLRDVVGTATLTCTNITKSPPVTAPLLDPKGVSPRVQGDGLSFIALLLEDIDTLTPPEFLAFVSANCDPKDVRTYPDKNIWEWLSGLMEEFAADGLSNSGGLNAGWVDPGHSNSNSRARPGVR